jgi:hypothetical protein
LKLQYDEPLSSFAFNFNLRRYTEGGRGLADMAAALKARAFSEHALHPRRISSSSSCICMSTHAEGQ